mgnify:FL=1
MERQATQLRYHSLRLIGIGAKESDWHRSNQCTGKHATHVKTKYENYVKVG